MGKRNKSIVLGREIGTDTGWDECGDYGDIILYGFEPNPNIRLPAGDIGVSLLRGVFEVWDKDGEVTNSIDIIEALKSAPKTNTETS